MDSLCRMFYEGKRYNGFPQEEVGAEGAKKLAINVFKNGILSRGVLLEKTAGLKVTAGARRGHGGFRRRQRRDAVSR